MKNIHLLPTDKPSRLGYLTKKGKEVFNDLRLFEKPMPNILDSENQNIYITSDEEITGFENNIWVIKGERIFLWQNMMALVSNNKPKKIILTTDTDLIKDNVQAIDDEFLEWFVKNPSCERVKVEDYGNLYNFRYLILIPKEEPKQENCCTPEGQIKRYVDCKGCDRKPKQETLSEAALKYSSEPQYFGKESGFRAGAKWQQERMYSEEEVLEIVSNCDGSISQAKKWFKQFKKK